MKVNTNIDIQQEYDDAFIRNPNNYTFSTSVEVVYFLKKKYFMHSHIVYEILGKGDIAGEYKIKKIHGIATFSVSHNTPAMMIPIES